jgi:hypothetical protein
MVDSAVDARTRQGLARLAGSRSRACLPKPHLRWGAPRTSRGAATVDRYGGSPAASEPGPHDTAPSREHRTLGSRRQCVQWRKRSAKRVSRERRGRETTDARDGGSVCRTVGGAGRAGTVTGSPWSPSRAVPVRRPAPAACRCGPACRACSQVRRPRSVLSLRKGSTRVRSPLTHRAREAPQDDDGAAQAARPEPV